jgi:uncharacterized protein with PIN domain
MSTEPLLEKSTKLETTLEDVVTPVRIKPAKNIARCFECETSIKTLTNFVMLNTNEPVLLCPQCEIKLQDIITRPKKISKKERRRLKKI